MQLTLKRLEAKESGVFGQLLDWVGQEICVTLEHAFCTPLCTPKIPVGTYTCVRGQHQLHSGPIETFEVTGVIGHSGLLFHYGNYNRDSDGCVLLGRSRVGDAITLSREAFDEFMQMLAGVNSFTLVVE